MSVEVATFSGDVLLGFQGPRESLIQIVTDARGRVFARAIPNIKEAERVITLARVVGMPAVVRPSERTSITAALKEHAIPRMFGGELHLDFRGRGGLLRAEAGPAAGNRTEALTYANYSRASREALSGGTAVMDLHGRSIEGSLRQPHEVRESIIERGRRALEASQLAAQEEREKVLRAAEDEMRVILESSTPRTNEHALALIARVNAESRVMLRRIDRTMNEAMAGVERDAREISLFFAGEMGHITHTARTEIAENVQRARVEMDAAFARVHEGLQQAIQEGTTEGRAQVKALFEELVTRERESFSAILRLVKDRYTDWATLFPKLGDGLIIDFADRGRMLIKQLEGEVRITSDFLLAKKMKGAKVLIQTAEGTIEHVVGSWREQITLLRASVPRTLHLTRDAFRAGWQTGLNAALFGIGPVDQLVREVEGAVFRPNGVSIRKILEFINEQDQRGVTAIDRSVMYQAAVRVATNLNFWPTEEERRRALLQIGLAVQRDLRLMEPSGYCFRGDPVDRRAEVIDAIPDPDIIEALSQDPEGAEEHLFPSVRSAQLAPAEEVEKEDLYEIRRRSLQAAIEEERERTAILDAYSRDLALLERQIEEDRRAAVALAVRKREELAADEERRRLARELELQGRLDDVRKQNQSLLSNLESRTRKGQRQ